MSKVFEFISASFGASFYSTQSLDADILCGSILYSLLVSLLTNGSKISQSPREPVKNKNASALAPMILIQINRWESINLYIF